MNYIIVFISIHWLSSCLSLSKRMANLSENLHISCVEFLGNKNLWGEIPAGFVCAREIQSFEVRSLMIQTGLFHVLVVSGSHLATLRKVNSYRILILLGAIYTLMCRMDPPITRAYLFLVVTVLSTSFKLHWKPSRLFLHSFFLSLLWVPRWFDSISLLLSLAAALSLALCSQCRWTRNSPSRSGILIFLMLFPFLAGWSQNNPLTLLSQVFLLSPLNLLLWSLSLFSMLVPEISSVLYEIFRHLFGGVQSFILPWQAPFETPLLLKWALLALYFELLRRAEQLQQVEPLAHLTEETT